MTERLVPFTDEEVEALSRVSTQFGVLIDTANSFLCTDDSTGMGAMVTLMEMFEKSWDEFCVPLSLRIRQAEVLEEESERCEVVDIRGDRDGGAA